MHGGAADFRPPQFGCKQVKSIYHRCAVSSKLTQFFVDIGLRRYFTCGFRRENSKDSVGFYIRPEDAYPRRSGRGRARGACAFCACFAVRQKRAYVRDVYGEYVRLVSLGYFDVPFGAARASRVVRHLRRNGFLRHAFDVLVARVPDCRYDFIPPIRGLRRLCVRNFFVRDGSVFVGLQNFRVAAIFLGARF